jgi:hypothetical protein
VRASVTEYPPSIFSPRYLRHRVGLRAKIAVKKRISRLIVCKIVLGCIDRRI